MCYHRPKGLCALVGALVFLSPLSVQAAPSPVVMTDGGALQGRVASDGVASFKGVPFAKPPVGPLRWRPPQRPSGWAGVRAADAYGAICMQTVVKDNGVGPGPDSEDCLTLNVFTPRPDPARGHAADLPVMVWIHGGGFVNGSGTADLYDGSKLAEQGVVVVTLNYRLGRFGFFAHPALTAERPAVSLANYGLMDQIAALQWVQRNIAAFGGDPQTVTVFGESAGGMSVDRLMTTSAAQGLFRRTIVESGVGRETGRTLAEAEAEGRKFAVKMNVRDETAAALRAIPADAIVAAGQEDLPKGEGPIVDGQLWTADPLVAFEQRQEVPVDYLIGSNSLEIPPGIAMPGIRPLAFSPAQIAGLEKAYGSRDLYQEHIVSDVVFTEPARSLARAHLKSGHVTYLYRFSVVSAQAPKRLTGAVHASDRQYVFKTLAASPWPTDARDASLAETISAYWVAFAKTGDPNGAGRPVWPRYGETDKLLNFTNQGPVVQTTPDARVLDSIAHSYSSGRPRAN